MEILNTGATDDLYGMTSGGGSNPTLARLSFGPQLA
jgi:hypothetical protein